MNNQSLQGRFFLLGSALLTLAGFFIAGGTVSAIAISPAITTYSDASCITPASTFNVGDTVYLGGVGFNSEPPADWSITGTNVSDFESGINFDGGSFCITARTILSGEVGTYDVNVAQTLGDEGSNSADTTYDVNEPETPATLTIIKNTDPDSGDGTFGFDVDGTGDSEGFSGSDSITTIGNTGTEDFTIPAGTYNVTENVPEEWHLVDVACVYENQDAGREGPANGEAIEVESGDHVICTFTDTKRAAIIIYKTVVNDNGGTAVASDFSYILQNGDALNTPVAFTQNQDSTHGKNIVFVNHGEYSVGEPENEGYTASGDGCSEINLDESNKAICYLTNNDKPATLTIVKNSDNTTGQFNFSIIGTGETQYSNSTSITTNSDLGFVRSSSVINLNAGTYEVREFGQEGWHLADVTCVYDNDSIGNEGILLGSEDISVDNGDSVTCTFTNTKRATLKVKKVVINDNGGTKTASDFSYSVNEGDPISFVQKEDALHGQNFSIADAGVFTVVETPVSGYTTTYDNCSEVAINAVAEATCVITNDDIAPTDGGGGGNAYVPTPPTTPPSNPTPPPEETPPPPSTVTPPPVLGDANGDSIVNYLDFSIFMSNWMKTGENVCDFNGDGVVDQLDYSILMSQWAMVINN